MYGDKPRRSCFSLLPPWGEGELIQWLEDPVRVEELGKCFLSKARFFWKSKRKGSSVYLGSTMRRVTSAFISPSHHNSSKLGLMLFISQKRNLALRGCHIRPASPSYNLNPARRGTEKTASPGPHRRRVLSPAGPGPGSPRPCPARAPASPGRPHRENRLARRARVAQLQATSLRSAGAPRLLGVASRPHGAPAHNNLSSTQPPESGAVTSRERPSQPAGSATRVRRGVAMGTELPLRSRLWVDFLVFGVRDDVEASRSLGDNGWAPSVGVQGPFSQGTRADVRAAEHTFQLGSTGLRMRAARSSVFESCRNI